MKGDALDLLQQFANGGTRRTKRDRERDLADEVRVLRQERSDAMNYFLDLNSFGSPPKYTADYGPTLLNQIQGLAGYYDEMMDEERAKVERLKKRVVSLEQTADPDDDCECVVRTALEARVSELETQCDRCGLKLTHVQPENDEMYSTARISTNADDAMHYIDKTYGEVFI